MQRKLLVQTRLGSLCLWVGGIKCSGGWDGCEGGGGGGGGGIHGVNVALPFSHLM